MVVRFVFSVIVLWLWMCVSGWFCFIVWFLCVSSLIIIFLYGVVIIVLLVNGMLIWVGRLFSGMCLVCCVWFVWMFSVCFWVGVSVFSVLVVVVGC